MQRALLSFVALALYLPVAGASASTFSTLYQFGGPDGSYPGGPIAIDRAGNIFGATDGGGVNGTIFELSPPGSGLTNWTETVLWNLPNEKKDGSQPRQGIIRDARGHIFGTTSYDGGAHCGTIFELHHTVTGWKSSILWTFLGGISDGCGSSTPLTLDSGGALYGGTSRGGRHDNGVVFKLSPPAAGSHTWTESVLWNFENTENGTGPSGQLRVDSTGSLFGTSDGGGPGHNGTVWQLVPPGSGQSNWSFSLLWGFAGNDGSGPEGGPLAADPSGALYGLCRAGGPYKRDHGLVYKLTPPTAGGGAWTESPVWIFDSRKGFGSPAEGVVRAPNGHLIVTTSDGSGTVTELIPKPDGTGWRASVLVRFPSPDQYPHTPPVMQPHGVLFGTTFFGGLGYGTVWQLTP
jgi:uncharacterized repeat protein (TIGR03803 family)